MKFCSIFCLIFLTLFACRHHSISTVAEPERKNDLELKDSAGHSIDPSEIDYFILPDPDGELKKSFDLTEKKDSTCDKTGLTICVIAGGTLAVGLAYLSYHGVSGLLKAYKKPSPQNKFRQDTPIDVNVKKIKIDEETDITSEPRQRSNPDSIKSDDDSIRIKKNAPKRVQTDTPLPPRRPAPRHLFEDTSVNLRSMPNQIRHWNPGSEVSIGDLHGNTVKMIYFLVHEGGLKFKNASDYQSLVRIYEQGADLTPEVAAEFRAILARAAPGDSPGVKFRFIGDMLADRGKNDALTLLTLQRMNELHMDYEVILSNHDLVFMQAVDGLGMGQAASFVNYERFLNKSGAQTIYQDILDQAYYPKLKLLSYAATQEGKLSLFSHAPINLDAIQAVARIFGVPVTPPIPSANLPGLIDQINRAFQIKIKDSNWRRQLAQEVLNLEGDHQPASPWYPFWLLTWNRNPQLGQSPSSIEFVHGHDITERPGYTNLDNTLGKYDFDPGLHQIHAVGVPRSP
jgi:hypothetical protein